MPKYNVVNKLLLLAFMLLVNIGIGYSQGGCNSNDFTVNNFYIGDINGNPITTTCTPGTPQSAYLYASFTKNTNADRYSLNVQFNLEINDIVTINNYNDCFYNQQVIPTNTSIQLFQIDYTCGDKIEVTNILLNWETTADPCGPANSKGKCFNDVPGFEVDAPLVANFSYINPCNSLQVDFTDLTTGGENDEDYTYSWNFGDGNTSIEDSPSHIYGSTGDYTVTLTITDFDGLVDTQTYTVTVYPSVSAILDSKSNVLCSGNADGSISITASGGDETYSYNWTGPNGFTSSDEDLIDLEAGTYDLVVTDSRGCEYTNSYEINVSDNTDPIITAPTDKDVEGCDTDDITNGGLTALPYSPTSATITEAQYTAEGGSFVEDNVALITYKDEISGTCPIVVTRTFTITDNCGATAFDTQLINIDDTIPPVITGGGPEVVECDGSGNTAAYNAWLMSNGGATATDACDDDVSWSWVVLSTTDNCGGTLVRHIRFNATDNCNNTSWYETTFTIEDTTDPTFTVPADITIECDDDETDLSLTGDVTDEADNCDTTLDATYSDSVAAGACANASVITRTWTLTDDCGNTTEQDQIITVQDSTDPTFTVPA
ncbi:SprB repeat-containing protein, partial [Zhouia amylolytica]